MAPELIESRGSSRIFNLYKALINHKILYRRFKNDIELAREVYNSITVYFKSDYHFWLQYGSLEMEGKGGDLLLSENYISQAESLAPKSRFVQTAKCNLLFRQAHDAEQFEKANDYKEMADELAQSLILTIGKEEHIIFHIYCAGRYNFLKKWINSKSEKKKELDDLRSSIKTGQTFHSFSHKLRLLSDAINRAYLQLGLDTNLEDPELPDFM